jgi:hypothetical protein
MTRRNNPPSRPGPGAAALPPELRRMEAMLGFQRRSWRVERLGWLAMLGLVLAGLLGAFGGSGWLAGATATTPDGALRITYDRAQRNMLPTVFRIEALRPLPEGRLQLRLGESLPAHWRVRSLLPSPAESRSDARGLVLTLQAAGPGPALALEAEPEGAGIFRLAIGLANGPPAILRILVWP